ncbi:MAG: beta-1,6-N-acetylglucosaminyltransferase [Candidatus Symbiothrix sp.]|jgi:hypothetical protein|nr:beta-1,6-N-acetylglucosaminyltransferase [Candidatus Symbiothrix sp.]
MKQAILITAYKNAQQLANLISYFDEHYEIYIHIDKKSTMDINRLSSAKNVHIYQKHIVNWGSFNHLKAILFLVSEALKDPSIHFFHLISGQDFPVKPLDYFAKLDQSKDYLDYKEISQDWKQHLEYYWFQDIFDMKKLKSIVMFVFKLQKNLRIKRTFPKDFPPLYIGSTWWSLTRNTLQNVMDYTENNPRILNRMKYTFCAEEVYFQTLILNFNLSNHIINDALRYMQWTDNASSPLFIQPVMFSEVIASNKLFARKLTEEGAEELKLLLLYPKNNLSL